MEKLRAFLKRKDIVFSAKRYFIDAMGAMAQGLFCTLLVGTILNTIGQQFHIGFLNAVIVTIGKGDYAFCTVLGFTASIAERIRRDGSSSPFCTVPAASPCFTWRIICR